MNKIILRIVYFSKQPPQNDLDEIYNNAMNLVELHQMSYILGLHTLLNSSLRGPLGSLPTNQCSES